MGLIQKLRAAWAARRESKQFTQDVENWMETSRQINIAARGCPCTLRKKCGYHALSDVEKARLARSAQN